MSFSEFVFIFILTRVSSIIRGVFRLSVSFSESLVAYSFQRITPFKLCCQSYMHRVPNIIIYLTSMKFILIFSLLILILISCLFCFFLCLTRVLLKSLIFSNTNFSTFDSLIFFVFVFNFNDVHSHLYYLILSALNLFCFFLVSSFAFNSYFSVIVDIQFYINFRCTS